MLFAITGNSRAAGGALLMAALISPALVEAWRPGVYLWRKPEGGLPDTLFNRMRQFRADHPGTDGTIILAFLVLLGTALLASSLLRLFHALNWR